MNNFIADSFSWDGNKLDCCTMRVQRDVTERQPVVKRSLASSISLGSFIVVVVY